MSDFSSGVYIQELLGPEMLSRCRYLEYLNQLERNKLELDFEMFVAEPCLIFTLLFKIRV